MSRYLALLFFTIHSFFLLAGEPDSSSLDRSIAEGYKHLYYFRFLKADSLVGELRIKHPNDERVHLFSANICWWKIRSGEDTPLYRKNFISSLMSAELMLDRKKKSDLSYSELFDYVLVYSFMSRLELLNENYFKAFSYMNKCNKYLFATFGKEALFESFCLTSGLYNYSLVSAKKKYPPLIPFLIMLPVADKEKGIQFLKKCAGSGNENLSAEGNYFLMIIYGEGDVDLPIAQSYAEQLSSRYASNLLYRYYYFKVLLEDGKKTLAMNEYKLLYQSSLANKELSQSQRKHFLNLAQKDLEKYYLKHPENK